MAESTSQFTTDSSDADFMTDVMAPSEDVPVIVDFWAPWCGPCKSLGPVIERLVEEQGGKVRLVKINTDENPGVAGQLNVRSIPAVFVIKDGKPIDGFVGNQPESTLRDFISKHAGTGPLTLNA